MERVLASVDELPTADQMKITEQQESDFDWNQEHNQTQDFDDDDNGQLPTYNFFVERMGKMLIYFSSELNPHRILRAVYCNFSRIISSLLRENTLQTHFRELLS